MLLLICTCLNFFFLSLFMIFMVKAFNRLDEQRLAIHKLVCKQILMEKAELIEAERSKKPVKVSISPKEIESYFK